MISREFEIAAAGAQQNAVRAKATDELTLWLLLAPKGASKFALVTL